MDLGLVERWAQRQLGDPGRQVGQLFEHVVPGVSSNEPEVVGEDDALGLRQRPERESGIGLGLGALEAHREIERHREVEQHVEELRALLQCGHVGGEVGDVEPPQHGPLELGATLAPDLVDVRVVPQVLHSPGEPAVAVEEAGGVGDRPPPEAVEFRVERQVDPEVLAPVELGRVARPRARHHDRAGRGRALPQCLIAGGGGGVGGADAVGADDQELGARGVAEALYQRFHNPDGT